MSRGDNLTSRHSTGPDQRLRSGTPRNPTAAARTTRSSPPSRIAPDSTNTTVTAGRGTSACSASTADRCTKPQTCAGRRQSVTASHDASSSPWHLLSTTPHYCVASGCDRSGHPARANVAPERTTGWGELWWVDLRTHAYRREVRSAPPAPVRHVRDRSPAPYCAADSPLVPAASVVVGGECGDGLDAGFRVAGEGARVLVSAFRLKQDGGDSFFAEVGER